MELNFKHAPIVSEKQDSNSDVMESVVFTNLNTKLIGEAKPSEIIPLLKAIGSEWGVNITWVKHFNIAKRILKNSVKNN